MCSTKHEERALRGCSARSCSTTAKNFKIPQMTVNGRVVILSVMNALYNSARRMAQCGLSSYPVWTASR